VGPAGVAVYSVGATKDIPGIRKYVSVDGGMGDNIRPALYDAHYEAVVANRMNDLPTETITLAGKFCESSDVLVRDFPLPALHAGDLIAIPASGGYAPSMASNYNLAPRPAIILVKDGEARVIRRRESYEDMMSLDVA
jgi:diaminopimelate decarboxylase